MQKKDSSALSNLSLDELIDSLAAEIELDLDDSKSVKNWSMSDIDALLGIGEDSSSKEDSVNVNSTAFSQKDYQKTENISAKPDEDKNLTNTKTLEIKNTDEKVETISKEQDFKDDIADDKTRVFNSDKEIERALATFEPEEDIALEKLEESKPTSFEKTMAIDTGKTQQISETKENKPEIKKPKILDFKANVTEQIKPASQKTLTDIKPTYNENIKHNIITQKIEKPTSGMETDKYRDRFINPPVQNLEKTADYERLRIGKPAQKIERPGIIVKKGGFSNTADLEPIPTIISAEEELKNVEESEKAKEPKNKTVEKKDEIAGQIKLSGFEENDEIIKVDEEKAEKYLKKSRKEKIKDFQLSTDLDHIPDIEYDDDLSQYDENLKSDKKAFASLPNYTEDEYNGPEDKSRILQNLSKAKKFALAFSVVELLILIASMTISSIVKLSGGNFASVGGSATNYLIIHIALLVLACAFEIGTFTKGVQGLFSLKPNVATGNSIVFFLCVAQCIVFIFTAQSSAIDFVVYAPVACFIFTVSAFSKFFTLSRVLGNFEFCTGGTALYSVEEIQNEADSFEIGRGLLLGDPDICYSSRIKNPSNFIAQSFSQQPSDKLATKLIPSVLGASLLVAIISGVTTKDAVSAFSSFVAITCVGFPAFSLFSSNLSLYVTNKKLNSNGCAILGHKATVDLAGANAIVVDSYDLFKKGRCGLDGIKTFHSMRIDEAILNAAALVIESGGPLSDVFDSVILGRREILPPVESLAYEDRLGLSAWIHGRRVLLGSRDLLINHNVEVPDIAVEEKYLKRGKNVMYLSVAGKVAAMFVISYYANENIGRSLRKVEERGLTILVRTSDSNITEELLCQYFKLPLSAVKIISPVSGDIYNKYRKTTLDSPTSGILHKGTEDSFLTSLTSAIRLNKLSSVNGVVQIVYCAVAISIFALLSFLSGLANVDATEIIVFQFAWTAIASLIPIFKRS